MTEMKMPTNYAEYVAFVRAGGAPAAAGGGRYYGKAFYPEVSDVWDNCAEALKTRKRVNAMVARPESGGRSRMPVNFTLYKGEVIVSDGCFKDGWF
jgi:hypothetical protein